MNPKVSVIIPAFNRVKLLSEAIGSAQLQSFGDLQIVVVDDDSPEDIESVVRSCAVIDSRVKYVRQAPNRGQAAARHLGVLESCGEYIQFLDSDDLLHPEKLRVQVATLTENPGIDMAIAQTAVFNVVPGDGMSLWNTFLGEDPLLRMCKGEMPWQIAGPLMKREAYLRSGGLDPSLRKAEDLEFCLRMVARGCTYLLQSYAFVYYRMHIVDQLSVVHFQHPTLTDARTKSNIISILRERGVLDDELLNAILTSLARSAHRNWEYGNIEVAKECLLAAAENAKGATDSQMFRDIAESLPPFSESAAHIFQPLLDSGFDWSSRVRWFGKHLIANEGLLPIPTARRYGRQRV